MIRTILGTKPSLGEAKLMEDCCSGCGPPFTEVVRTGNLSWRPVLVKVAFRRRGALWELAPAWFL